MTYTHRPTGLEGTNPETDRSVYCDGECIARIYQFRHGPMEGQWGWFGLWGSNDNTGIVDTLEAALQAVKRQHVTTSHGDKAISLYSFSD